MNKQLQRAAICFLVITVVVEGGIACRVGGRVLSGHADFASFYAAGTAVRRGQGDRLYDPQEQWKIQQEFAGEMAIRQGPMPYLRLPFEALLFVPFTFLPYSSAYALWLLLNLSAAIGATWFLCRRLDPLCRLPTWLPLLMTFAFAPVFLTLVQGQDAILVWVFYSLAFVALRNGVDFRAGCYLGLGWIKPHLVLPFVAIALLRGKRKTVWGFLLLGAAFLAASVWLVGWSRMLHYPAYLWELERHTERGLAEARDNSNLRGLVEGFGGGLLSSGAITAVIVILSAALVGWVGLRHRSRDGVASHGRVQDLIFCQAAIAALLVSYHSFTYDWCLLLLPIFLLMKEWGEETSGVARAALFGPIAVLFVGPIYPLLWMRWHSESLIAVILLVWLWGMDKEISRAQSELALGIG